MDVVPALPGDEPIVGEILDDARRWLASRGSAQWAAPFSDEWVGQKIAAGEFHIGRSGGDAVAVLRLLWADPLFWGDRDRGDAAYVHTMAVRRTYAGREVGARLLRWAAEQTRANERRFLRLDCGADNLGLIAYYRGQGFTSCGTAEIGGTTVMLFEKVLGA